MKHKVSIRDLNAVGNQAPVNSGLRKKTHEVVLEAIEGGVAFITLDDEIREERQWLNLINVAKGCERYNNRRRLRGFVGEKV